MQGGSDMDSNITFRIDSEIKQQMSEICKELGMSPSAAFNLFANAFVRVKGMPFPVTVQNRNEFSGISAEQMGIDAEHILNDFAGDYARMAK